MDLTIVITSRNRPEKLIRVVEYFDFIRFPGKLLIGDASTFEKTVSIKDRLRKCSFDHEYYWHEGLKVFESHQFLASRLNTQYSMCIADGGIIILDGIKKCLLEIDANQEIIAISGRTFMFDFLSSGNLKSLSNYQMPNYLGDRHIERLHQICSEYIVPMYCLMRSSTWTDIWRGSETIPEKSFSAEIIPAMRLALKGKLKQINEPFLLREMHPNRTKLISGENFLKSPNFNKVVETSLDLLFKEANALDPKITKENIKAEFDLFLREFTKSKKSSDKHLLRDNVLFAFKKLIYRIVPFIDLILMQRRKRYFAKQFNWDKKYYNSFKESLNFLNRFNL